MDKDIETFTFEIVKYFVIRKVLAISREPEIRFFTSYLHEMPIKELAKEFKLPRKIDDLICVKFKKSFRVYRNDLIIWTGDAIKIPSVAGIIIYRKNENSGSLSVVACSLLLEEFPKLPGFLILKFNEESNLSKSNDSTFKTINDDILSFKIFLKKFSKEHDIVVQ